MNIDINDWKLSRDSTPIAQILGFLSGIESTQIVSKSLDGTQVAIQTVGLGTPYAQIIIFSSLEEKDEVDIAQAEGAALTAVYRGKRYLGYLEAAPQWEPVVPGEWYQSVVKMLIEESEVL